MQRRLGGMHHLNEMIRSIVMNKEQIKTTVYYNVNAEIIASEHISRFLILSQLKDAIMRGADICEIEDDIDSYLDMKTPDCITNGFMLKTVFPNIEVQEIYGTFNKELIGYRTFIGGRSQDYYLDWWNAPYSENLIG